MATVSTDDLRNLGDFGVTNTWEILVPSIPNGVSGMTSEQLNFTCESISPAPGRTTEPITAMIRGAEVSQPGDLIYNKQTTLTFLAGDNPTVDGFFQQWEQVIAEYNTHKMGKKSDIEAGIIINRLNRQGEKVSSKEMKAWMSEYTPGDYTGAAEARMTTVTLNFDHYKDK